MPHFLLWGDYRTGKNNRFPTFFSHRPLSGEAQGWVALCESMIKPMLFSLIFSAFTFHYTHDMMGHPFYVYF